MNKMNNVNRCVCVYLCVYVCVYILLWLQKRIKVIACFISVIQLIKSTTENRRLDVIIVGRKKDTYIFDDVKTREKFCQHIQQLKNLFSDAEELDRLSVFIGTWNMGETQRYS